jgi:hypothetical protein
MCEGGSELVDVRARRLRISGYRATFQKGRGFLEAIGRHAYLPVL